VFRRYRQRMAWCVLKHVPLEVVVRRLEDNLFRVTVDGVFDDVARAMIGLFFNV
jgi:hypothetical protein